jgi:hypothetical protein
MLLTSVAAVLAGARSLPRSGMGRGGPGSGAPSRLIEITRYHPAVDLDADVEAWATLALAARVMATLHSLAISLLRLDGHDNSPLRALPCRRPGRPAQPRSWRVTW